MSDFQGIDAQFVLQSVHDLFLQLKSVEEDLDRSCDTRRMMKKVVMADGVSHYKADYKLYCLLLQDWVSRWQQLEVDDRPERKAWCVCVCVCPACTHTL